MAEDEKVAELIELRQEDERLQGEAEARLAAEQATRAEEDARLRELYPIEEDEPGYGAEDSYENEAYVPTGESEPVEEVKETESEAPMEEPETAPEAR